MTNFLEIKSKVARCLMVGCAMIMGMNVEAADFNTYKGKTVALVAYDASTGKYYAMRRDEMSSPSTELTSVSSYQVFINAESELYFLDTRTKLYRISFALNSTKTNTTIYPFLYSSETESYSINKDKYLTSISKKLSIKTTSTTPTITWEWQDDLGTWAYTSSSKKHSILFRTSEQTFYIDLTSNRTTSLPLAKPYLLADHTWRTLGASYFGTICLPKAVRAAERAGATFYEIAAKIVDEGVFKGIVLREVTGELEAGKPYIFKKNNAETTYIVAAMHGDAASASSSNGLVGRLGDSAGEGYAVPAGMYILQGDQLLETTEGHSRILEGRAYINPAEIGTTVTSAEVAGVKGYVLGLDEPFDAVRSIKTERSGSEGDIRDLLGRRVERVSSGRMYVIGGRKVLIR